MPVLISSPHGRGIPVYTSTSTTSKIGSETIVQITILEDEFNYQVVRGIRKRWILSQLEGPKDKREYVAFIIDRETHGRLQEVKVSFRDKAIDIIKRTRVHQQITGTMKPQDYFKMIFKDTGLNYTVPDDLFYAEVKEAGEGQSVEELVKKALDLWDLEFDIEFDDETKKYTFVFKPYLEKKANYHIDDEINANNMKIEEDSGDMYTYVVGYGDYTDDEGIEGAGLLVKFEHPEMEDIGKFEAPPVKDGNIKDEAVMRAKLQTIINESIKTSITLDFIYLRTIYKNAIAKTADIVKVKHAILGINEFMRIVDVKTVRDANNVIVSQDVTLGDFNRQERYLKRLGEAAQVVGGLGGGSFASSYRNTQNRTNAVLQSTKNAIDTTKALNGDTDGIRGKSDDNILEFNTGGKLQVSHDKGETWQVIVDAKTGFNSEILPTVDDKNAGLMSVDDKKKLDTLDVFKIKGEDGTSYDLSQLTVDKDGNLKVKEVK